MTIICGTPFFHYYVKSVSSYITVYMLLKPPTTHCACSPQCMPERFSTTQVGKTWRSMQGIFSHFKVSSRFPNFDEWNAWQIVQNSRDDCFLGQELLLDFAAWNDLTSNAETRFVWTPESTFWFFKTYWWITGLSRLYNAFNHQAGMQSILKEHIRASYLLFRSTAFPLVSAPTHMLRFTSQWPM